MFNDGILEPIKYYDETLKDGFSLEAEKFFDGLVKKSGVNVDENRALSAKYREKRALADGAAAKLSKLKGVQAAIIVYAVLAIITSIYLFAKIGTVAANAVGGTLIFTAVVAIIIIFTVMLKKISASKAESDELSEKADEIKARAEESIAPLNGLFESSMTIDLIRKAVPIIKIDKNFDIRRYDYMHGKYGFGENTDQSQSTIALMSGEIVGNPFVIERRLKMTMGFETYHGSRIITYTEHYTDSDGKSRTRTVSETLYATVTKPKPFYSESTVLVYGNDAAPKLVFSRKPSHAETLTDKQAQRAVSKGAKKLRKKTLKDASDDDPTTNYTKMGNDEFEVLFNATDRNDEVEFRLLFTVLAQRNMVALMRGKSGYGDDFYFNKRKCLNYIKSEHFQDFETDDACERYLSYDLEIERKNFVDYNCEYFRKFYFLFAPVLSIPLYQQQKPREYIYQKTFHRNVTSYEAERLANAVGQGAFENPASETPSILKTELMTKAGGSDKVSVKAYSFRIERRCEEVPVFGGDGRSHLVSVYWDDYIPISNLSVMDIKELGYSEREFSESKKAQAAKGRGKAWAYSHGIFARAAFKADAELDKEFDN